MPSRKTHNKTRLGCGQCKKRRIKCDGKQPTCANCEKRGLECSFLLLIPTSRLSAAGSTSSTLVTATTKRTPYDVQVFKRDESSPRSLSPTPSLSPSYTFGRGILPKTLLLPRGALVVDVWDERKSVIAPYHKVLLDHYEHSTCFTLATDGPAKSAWQSFVPGMASQHKYLVNGVLSVASLHLARLSDGKEERDSMNRIAADLMNRALIDFRSELHNINEKNAAALFAHSTLTAVYFFRTSALDMGEARAAIPMGMVDPPPKLIDKMIQSFIKTLWGLRGAHTVLRPGWNWVIGGEMSPICTRRWWPRHRKPQTARAKDEDKRLEKLEKLWKNPDRLYESHFECLSDALKYLRDTYALVSLLTDPTTSYSLMPAPISYAVDDTTVGTLRDRAGMFVWATNITREFLSLLEQKNRDALVLVAHWALLLGRVRNVWWLDGVGSNAIWAVAMAIGRENWHLIEWPIEAVGVDLDTELCAEAESADGSLLESIPALGDLHINTV